MIRLRDITLARGATQLLENASLTVHAGQKVGVIGANGAGKSSLFALLRGEVHQEAGDVELPKSWVVAHVAQETTALDTPALEHALDGDTELRVVERELAAAELAHEIDGHHVAELHQRYEAIGGYASRARAAELLAGLGVAAARHADPVSRFSGGWRMRLNLAQALMARSDLLLLDEPTNHLDLDAVLWLETWLARYEGTLLLITHDRDFLDRVVKSIVHFDARKLKAYGGNYSVFERERAAYLAMQRSAYDKQQRQITHLKSYVDRFRAKASKARQAQSRLRTLEKMELIAAAHVDSPFEFTFAPAQSSAREIARLEDATLDYGDGSEPVFRGLDLAIANGVRVGLLGPNGAGKSTLVKALAGELALREGRRSTAQNLAIGYFAQHQLEQLDPERSPLAQMMRIDPAAREQELRDFLGGFDFRGDAVLAPAGRFSGGEKARLVLAMIVRAKPQLLILDEPTNHLDIEMREALSEALQDFTGALIVVAHDRHLLSATTDELWLVDEGRVAAFDGDLDDYRDWVLARARSGASSSAATGGAAASSATRGSAAGAIAEGGGSAGGGGTAAGSAQPAVDRRQQKRDEARERQRLADARKPFRARQTALERDIAALGEEKRGIDEWLASEAAYADEARDDLKQRLERQGELNWQLARFEAEWLALEEAAERAAAITPSAG